MIVAEYSNYIDPIMSMVYILTLIWTCVPLVRYAVEKTRPVLLNDISHQGFLPHSAPDHPWKRRRDSSKAVHSSKVPWDFGFTWGKLFVNFFFVVDGQVHVWTLTPSDMVLTAHITYQNRSVYTKIHTQVMKPKTCHNTCNVFFWSGGNFLQLARIF